MAESLFEPFGFKIVDANSIGYILHALSVSHEPNFLLVGQHPAKLPVRQPGPPRVRLRVMKSVAHTKEWKRLRRSIKRMCRLCLATWDDHLRLS